MHARMPRHRRRCLPMAALICCCRPILLPRPNLLLSFLPGYRNSEVPLPQPPAEEGGRSLDDFRRGPDGGNRSDTQAFAAMVAWANQQPPEAGEWWADMLRRRQGCRTV